MRRGLLSHVKRLGCIVSAALVPVFAAPTVSLSAEVTIAVVRDGDPAEPGRLSAIEAELGRLLPGETTVRFKEAAAFNAGWRADLTSEVLRRALEDEQVDVVLAMDAGVTRAATELSLAKPVISGFVQPSDLFRVVRPDGEGLTVEGLGLVVVSQNAEREIERFLQISPYRKLEIVISRENAEQIVDLEQRVRALAERLGASIDLARLGPDVDDYPATLDGDVEAVLLGRLPRVTRESRQRLVEGLTARGVATFSLVGHADVDLGALAAMTPDIEGQGTRRVALNLNHVVRGGETASLPVLMQVETQMLINGQTAKAIGFLPDRETLVSARFLYPEALAEAASQLTFAEALVIAERDNAALAVTDSEVESVRQQQRRAKSALLPQITADVAYAGADTSFFASDDAALGTLGVGQQIYDDASWAEFRASKRATLSAEQRREQQRLDVLEAAGSAYYSLALSRALLRIEAANMRLSEDFLELAKLRREVGYSGREEIVRWESAVAQGRSRVFGATQSVEAARIALNQILGQPQDRRWFTTEEPIDPEVFPFVSGRIDDLYDDPRALPGLREKLVGIAFENSPEVAAVDQAIEARQIVYDQRKRRFYLPTFQIEGAYVEQIGEPDSLLFGFDHEYQFSVSAAYPLYEGGRRKAEARQAEQDLQAAIRDRVLTRQLVEQSVRTTLRACENSFPRIKYGVASAEAAAENLDIVRDQYAEGTADVTDLLEAQNQNFRAEQLAIAAVYEFLDDLVGLQRALAWFDVEKSDRERDDLIDRLRGSAPAGRAAAQGTAGEGR